MCGKATRLTVSTQFDSEWLPPEFCRPLKRAKVRLILAVGKAEPFRTSSGKAAIPLLARKTLDVFHTAACIEQHDPLLLLNRSICDHLLQCGQTCCAFGRAEDSFRGANLSCRRYQFFIGDSDRSSARRSQCINDQKVANRFRHAQARGGRIPVGKFISKTLPFRAPAQKRRGPPT